MSLYDNLRDNSLYEDEPNDLYKEPVDTPAPSSAPRRRASSNSSSKFLGMTPMQRFVIAVMLMFTVCIMGALAMFVLGRMAV